MKKILPSPAFALSLALAGACAFGALSGGCATSSSAGQPSGDADITTRVKSDIAHDYVLSSFPANSVKVRTENGVVHLSGYVPTEVLKATVEKDAQTVGGVKAVVNDIIVNAGN